MTERQQRTSRSTRREAERTPEARTEARDHPPVGITGGKLRSRPEVALDWMRTVALVDLDDPAAHDDERERAVSLLRAHYGEPARVGGGKDFYRYGVYWENGATVLYGHSKAGPSLEVPGEALAELSFSEQVGLLTECMLGRRCTRLDIAVDFRDDRKVGLIDQVRELTVGPVREGKTDTAGRVLTELVGAKRVRPHEEWVGSRCVNWGVDIGRRGSDGSGRFVRVYDKGLKSGTCLRGHWERWETQLCKDVANQVAVRLATAESHLEAVSFAWEQALGAVDFKEIRVRKSGLSEGELVPERERPRSAWWQRIVGRFKHVRPTRERRKPTLDGILENAQNAMRGVAAIADALCVPRERLFALVYEALGNVKPRLGTRRAAEELVRRKILAGRAHART